jgi:hypothetical protein
MYWYRKREVDNVLSSFGANKGKGCPSRSRQESLVKNGSSIAGYSDPKTTNNSGLPFRINQNLTKRLRELLGFPISMSGFCNGSKGANSQNKTVTCISKASNKYKENPK